MPRGGSCSASVMPSRFMLSQCTGCCLAGAPLGPPCFLLGHRPRAPRTSPRGPPTGNPMCSASQSAHTSLRTHAPRCLSSVFNLAIVLICDPCPCLCVFQEDQPNSVCSGGRGGVLSGHGTHDGPGLPSTQSGAERRCSGRGDQWSRVGSHSGQQPGRRASTVSGVPRS